jgi:hypothetical protein
MKTIKLKHEYNRNLSATCHILSVVYENDTNTYYTGKVNYCENGLRLFSQKTNIIRASVKDAVSDCFIMAIEHNFVTDITKTVKSNTLAIA